MNFRYYCDYCDTFLTHDSPSVRKTHCGGRFHRDNVRKYYQEWLEQQVQKLVDQTSLAVRFLMAIALYRYCFSRILQARPDSRGSHAGPFRNATAGDVSPEAFARRRHAGLPGRPSTSTSHAPDRQRHPHNSSLVHSAPWTIPASLEPSCTSIDATVFLSVHEMIDRLPLKGCARHSIHSLLSLLFHSCCATVDDRFILAMMLGYRAWRRLLLFVLVFAFPFRVLLFGERSVRVCMRLTFVAFVARVTGSMGLIIDRFCERFYPVVSVLIFCIPVTYFGGDFQEKIIGE